MDFISLFSGIGGMDLGLERAGWTCVAQVEIDEYATAVLARHWPNTLRHRDVRAVGRHNLPRCSAVVGGFPCQPHSLAGLRRGAEDDRNLWPEFIRIVRECEPDWVLAENVPGIRTTIADTVINDLGNAGYACWPLVVGADDAGAPHRRKRVFFVGWNGRRSPGPFADALGVGKREPADQTNALTTGREARDESGDRRQSSNTNDEGLAERKGVSGDDGQEQPSALRGDWWGSQSGLGGCADGASHWMDGTWEQEFAALLPVLRASRKARGKRGALKEKNG